MDCALAHIEGHCCSVISRNGDRVRAVAATLRRTRARCSLPDRSDRGEICCLQPDGRTNFHDLLFRGKQPYFYAFDLLMLNGEDLRRLSLIQRKRHLAVIMPTVKGRVLFLDSIAERGRDFFRVAWSVTWRGSLRSGRAASIRPTRAARPG